MGAHTVVRNNTWVTLISIINHILPITIRAVIDTLACTSMTSNSMSDSECY